MSLSSDLISQFVKVTKDDTEVKKETITYGIVKEVKEDGSYMIEIDGADGLTTPAQSTVNATVGNRVVLMIKNHTATITGNISNPSAKSVYSADEVTEMEVIVAHRLTTEQLNAIQGNIDRLYAKIVNANKANLVEADIETLNSKFANVTEITAEDATIIAAAITSLEATFADITDISTEELNAINAEISSLKAYTANFTYVSADVLKAMNANIKKLQTDSLTVKDIEGKYANIDFSNIEKAAVEAFFSKSGMIDDLVVGAGTITGKLVGVTISGDLIEGNTVKADKLVVKGSDGLYYKLNIEAGATTSTEVSETDLQNGLHGTAIIAKTITAEKISVDDLVAFGATIGGFHISNQSLYSGVKDSVNNTTRGTYLDDDGQVVFGDSTNFIKFFKDTDGNYKLAISASSLIFSSSNKNVEQAISDVQKSVDDIDIGGRNLLINSTKKIPAPHAGATISADVGVAVDEWSASDAIRIYGTGGTAKIFGYLTGLSVKNMSVLGQTYTCSMYAKNTHASNQITVSSNGLDSDRFTLNPGESIRIIFSGVGSGQSNVQFNFETPNIGEEFDLTYWHPKIEFGNQPTDWTPAPEDMATSDEVDAAQSTADEANERAVDAQTLIAKIQDSITMLVTDGNGTSLMTQEGDSWTFSTAGIQEATNAISEALAALTNTVGDNTSAVDILKQAISDLGNIAEYVKITIYEDEPCIELGESDSDFKLRITNTRMMFIEGSTVLAYFNNQAFQVKKVVVEEELQQGGFVWKIRSNGNLALVWKGDDE